MVALSKTLGALSIAALIAAGAGGALAQSPQAEGKMDATAAAADGEGKQAHGKMHRRAGRFIRIFDTDGSGGVSLAEIEAEQKRMLAAADLDGDGKLSVKEFRRRGLLIRSLGTTSLFDLLDVDGDQHVAAGEIAAPSARWFKRYDANGDGAISAEELPSRKWHGKGRRGPGSK